MIAFIQGKINLKEEKYIVLDVNGIGYKIFLSRKALSEIPKNNQSLKVFTFLYSKDEKLELYGFLTREELGLFEILKRISGVGPKSALVLASFGSLEKLKEILEKPDENFFKEVKGIGKKRIQRIMLEITGRIKESKKVFQQDEAMEALKSLGLSSIRAKQALSQVSKEIKNPEERVKQALRILSKS